MPKAKAHEIISTVTGVAASARYAFYIDDSDNVASYVAGGALAAYFLSRLPDILEPSQVLGPNHRGFFHGVAFNGGVAVGSFKAIKSLLDKLVAKAKKFEDDDRFVMAFLCRAAAGAVIGGAAGYASHLLADLTTPKGLPLVTRRL